MNNILQHPQFDAIAGQYEQSLGLPQGVLKSLIYQESRGNPNALSPAGAQGVAQFMPGTAKAYNVNVNDPWDSVRGAAEYLGDNLKKYGTIEAALADYNGGPRAAKAVLAGKAPPSPETQKYIPQIMSRLPKETAQAVTASAARGEDPALQVSSLRKAGFGEWIDDALNKGASYNEILSTLAPEAQARGNAAAAQKESDGLALSTIKKAGDKVNDAVLGGRQIYNSATGDTKTSALLQTQVAANRADPNRAARDAGASGVLGEVLAAVPLALASRYGIVGQSVVGAALGALEPTVEGESRLANTLQGATVLGGFAAGTRALGGAVQLASKLGRGAGSDSARAVLEANGITPSRAMMSPMLGKVEQTLGSVPGARLAVRDSEELVQKQVQAAIAKNAGSDVADLGHAAVQSAEQNLGKLYAKALDGRSVQVSDEVRSTLLDGMKAQITKADPMIRREISAEFGGDIASLEAGNTISANSLHKMRSVLGSDGAAATNTAAEKLAYGRTRDAVSKALEDGLPKEQYAAYAQAGQMSQNVNVMKDVVAKLKDDPTNKDVIKALEQAVTSAKNRKGVVHGNAPMQELQQALSGLHRDKSTLDDIVGGTGRDVLGALASVHTGGIASLGANMAMRFLHSPDPAVRAAFSKLPPTTQAAIAKKAMTVALGTQISG